METFLIETFIQKHFAFGFGHRVYQIRGRHGRLRTHRSEACIFWLDFHGNEGERVIFRAISDGPCQIHKDSRRRWSRHSYHLQSPSKDANTRGEQCSALQNKTTFTEALDTSVSSTQNLCMMKRCKGNRERRLLERIDRGKGWMRQAHLHHRDANNCSRPQMKDFKEESIYYCHSTNPSSVSKIIGSEQTSKERKKQQHQSLQTTVHKITD